MFDERKERFDRRSPVQPGRSIAPYFVLALIAAIVIWTAQQYAISDSKSQKTEAPPLLPSPPTITGPAASKGDVRSIFSAYDYPATAQAKGEQGTVQARLRVDEWGRVSSCRVIGSSGSDSLDNATCNIIERRARFTPARNAAGQAISSTVTTPPISWQLEG
jgi:periplasmic protein TonB